MHVVESKTEKPPPSDPAINVPPVAEGRMFWSLFLFGVPLTQELASLASNDEQEDLFHSAGNQSNLHWQHLRQGKSEERSGK